MTPCPDRDRLSAFSQGLVTGDELDELVRHVEECERCQNVLASLEPWATSEARFYMPSRELVEAVIGSAPEELHLDEARFHSSTFNVEELEHLAGCETCQFGYETVVLASTQADAFLPSEPLVWRAMRSRPRIPFRAFRARLASRRTESRHLTTVRRVAALLGGMGLSPLSLSAVMIVHAIVLVVAEARMAGQPGLGTSALDRLRLRSDFQEHALFFAVPRVEATKTQPSPSSVSRRRPRNAAAPRTGDSASEGRLHEEIARVVDRVLVFERDQGLRSAEIGSQLERVLAILLNYRDVRIRLEVEASPDTQPPRGTTMGMRDAEDVMRYLMERGVARERISIVVAEDMRAECEFGVSRECRLTKQRVRVAVVR